MTDSQADIKFLVFPIPRKVQARGLATVPSMSVC